MQDFPETLKQTESKLQEIKEENIKSTLDNEHLKETLALMETRFKAEKDKNNSLQEQISCLKELTTASQYQKDDINKGIVELQSQMNSKDVLLEKTSTQLEERIRECTRLASELDRVKNNHGKEVSQLKYQHSNDNIHQKYVDSQSAISRYQTQIATLKAEKDSLERTLRKNSRKYDDEMDRIKLRNSTLQKQMQSITATYHSMFGPLNAVGTNLNIVHHDDQQN